MRRMVTALAAALLLSALLLPAVAVGKADTAVQITPFTFEWPPQDPDVFCAGMRIEKSAPKALTMDLEVCSSTWEPGIAIFDPVWEAPDGSIRHWYSDYDSQTAVWAKWVTTPGGYSYITARY